MIICLHKWCVCACPVRAHVLICAHLGLYLLDEQNIADSMKALGVAKSQGELNEMVQVICFAHDASSQILSNTKPITT